MLSICNLLLEITMIITLSSQQIIIRNPYDEWQVIKHTNQGCHSWKLSKFPDFSLTQSFIFPDHAG